MITESRAADEINTPVKVLARDMKEQYHFVFNCNTFGIDNNGDIIDQSKLHKTKSKGLTNETWLEIVHVLSRWMAVDAAGHMGLKDD